MIRALVAAFVGYLIGREDGRNQAIAALRRGYDETIARHTGGK